MRGGLLRGVGRAALNGLVTLLIVLALWQLALTLFHVNAFIAKRPADVWRYLFVPDPMNAGDPTNTPGAHRHLVMSLTGRTLADAGLGFGTGLALATLLAIVFTLSKTVEAAAMPLALFLRAVPLVAIAPIIILITGIGTTASVATLAAIVVLFPALASVLFGLSRASAESLDLIHVYGGSSLKAMTKVAVPGALPSIFAAARVSVPGAITGALLAEWLSTGKGIGGAIITFSSSAEFGALWSAVAAITVLTLVLYNLVQMLENAVLAGMGMTQAAPS